MADRKGTPPAQETLDSTSVHRVNDAAKDAHAVMAWRKHSGDLLKLKELVEQVMQAR